MTTSQPNTPTVGQPVLRFENVSKSFGAIQAVQDVSFELHTGEIVGLVGDNGAGKSTIVKMISGVHQPTSGTMYLDGEPIVFENPKHARAQGIETVYQDLALVEELDVAGNFFLGREILSKNPLGRLFNVLRHGDMRERAQEALKQLHIRIPDPHRSVGNMSGGQRQAVAIGRTVFWGQKMMILDEPTAALGVEESEQVLGILESFEKDKALPILLVSHNMEQVHRVSDRIIVMRQGEIVTVLNKKDTTPQEIVGYITGAIQPDNTKKKATSTK